MQNNIINNNNVIANKLDELFNTSNELQKNLKINTQHIITNLENIKNEYYTISDNYNKVIKEKTKLQNELNSCNNNKEDIDNIKRNIAGYDAQIERIKENLNNTINEYSLEKLEKIIMQKLNEIKTKPIGNGITTTESATNPFANLTNIANNYLNRSFFNQNQTQPQNKTQNLKGGKLIKTKKNYKKTKTNKKNRKNRKKNK